MLDSLNLEELQKTVQELLTTWGLNAVAAVVILVFGWTFAKWARRTVGRGLRRLEAVDPTLRPLIARLVHAVVLVVTLIAVLGQLGVPTSSVLTVLGAAGLAVGLALQGTLSNIASGAMKLTTTSMRRWKALSIFSPALVVTMTIPW